MACCLDVVFNTCAAVCGPVYSQQRRGILRRWLRFSAPNRNPWVMTSVKISSTYRELTKSSLRNPLYAFQASNLNSIFEQLQGPSIRRVLRALDQSKSTYCTTFARLCKEVRPIASNLDALYTCYPRFFLANNALANLRLYDANFDLKVSFIASSWCEVVEQEHGTT